MNRFITRRGTPARPGFLHSLGKYLAVHEKAVVLAQDNEYQAGLLAQSEGDAPEAAAKILQDEVVLADKGAAAFAALGAHVCVVALTGSSASWCARC